MYNRFTCSVYTVYIYIHKKFFFAYVFRWSPLVMLRNASPAAASGCLQPHRPASGPETPPRAGAREPLGRMEWPAFRIFGALGAVLADMESELATDLAA